MRRNWILMKRNKIHGNHTWKSFKTTSLQLFLLFIPLFCSLDFCFSQKNPPNCCPFSSSSLQNVSVFFFSYCPLPQNRKPLSRFSPLFSFLPDNPLSLLSVFHFRKSFPKKKNPRPSLDFSNLPKTLFSLQNILSPFSISPTLLKISLSRKKKKTPNAYRLKTRVYKYAHLR